MYIYVYVCVFIAVFVAVLTIFQFNATADDSQSPTHSQLVCMSTLICTLAQRIYGNTKTYKMCIYLFMTKKPKKNIFLKFFFFISQFAFLSIFRLCLLTRVCLGIFYAATNLKCIDNKVWQASLG